MNAATRISTIGSAFFGTSRRRLLCFAALALGAVNATAPAVVVNLTMTLDGSQETPAVTTAGTGSGSATLDTVTNLFSWNISFSGLSAPESAAHFHGIGAECVPAGVLLALPLGSPKVGSSTVTPQQAADILAGLWYANIHTPTNPGGEIRGQVRPAPIANPIPTPIAFGSIVLQLETVATGLVAPNWGVSAPGISGRLYVTDQNGIIWNIDLVYGTKTVFLDVSSRLVPLGVFGPGSFDERGLLSVAFHPNYAFNGLLYTFTSEPVRGPADFSTIPVGQVPNCQSVLIEWNTIYPTDPASTVNRLSARVLMRIDKPQFNHNGGGLNFGPDGRLYISLGDGGGADDKDGQNFIGGPISGHGCIGNGQNPANPLGSMLRIDPQGNNSANGQYGIPVDNPFVGVMGFVAETHSYGYRNPWRFSFDRLLGTMYVADVGQNHIEEIDIGVAGYNYGWRHKEGSFFFIPNGNSSGYVTDVPQAGATGFLFDPIAQYDHDEGIAVIGGFVYRGSHIVPLQGRYVFGEFARTFANNGRLFYLDAANQIKEVVIPGQPNLGKFLLGFGEDATGEIYALVNGNGVPSGTGGLVLRLRTKPGDTNANGVVNIDDLVAVITTWGNCPDCTNCPGDVNHDCTVNIDDLVMVIVNWG